eukprot:5833807-Prymnesium_polylepis.3
MSSRRPQSEPLKKARWHWELEKTARVLGSLSIGVREDERSPPRERSRSRGDDDSSSGAETDITDQDATAEALVSGIRLLVAEGPDSRPAPAQRLYHGMLHTLIP